jgi:hypothetical protein
LEVCRNQELLLIKEEDMATALPILDIQEPGADLAKKTGADAERTQLCDSPFCSCPQDSRFIDAASIQDEIAGLTSPCARLPSSGQTGNTLAWVISPVAYRLKAQCVAAETGHNFDQALGVKIPYMRKNGKGLPVKIDGS